MPYFITDSAEGCSGWATIKDDGEVIGCHTTKQSAIDQMVAVSVAEDMEPGGERALPDNYRPALAQDVPEGRACGNCFFYDDDVVSEDGTKAYCRKWDEFVDGGYYCNAWQSDDDMDDMDEDNDDLRTVNDLQNEKWRSIALNLNKDERQQMTTQVERRVNTVEFDVRNGEASADGMSFTGYAAVFNSPSEPLPFTEVIREGAFKRSLKSRNEIKLFMNHNTDVVLGSTRAGTLKLTEDSRGLLAQADLPDTSAGRDLSVLMKRGDVSSMSFGFSVPPKGDAWSSDGATRELHQVRLHEVSIVTGFPAYEATTASVRSLDILAQRTAVDVDALSDAILKLEAGETLDANHADLISEVVQKLRADQPSEVDMLEIKRKQLDLMLKAF
jgi:HK97 family phage prohead protease